MAKKPTLSKKVLVAEGIEATEGEAKDKCLRFLEDEELDGTHEDYQEWD